jgi:hypothetical protein
VVNGFVSGFESLFDVWVANTIELDRVGAAAAWAVARFRAATDGAEQARLIQARAETESSQQFSFVNEPVLPQTPDAAGLDAFYFMLSFVIVGLATNVLPAVVSAMRSSTVLIPEDLAADPRLPVVAVVPGVSSSRLSVADRPASPSSRSTSSTAEGPAGTDAPSGADRGSSTRADGDGAAV